MGLVGSIEKGDADVKTDIATLRKVCKDDDVIVAALDKATRRRPLAIRQRRSR